MTDFLEHFPFPTIRDGQKIALTEIQNNIKDVEVFVVRAPVGAGKSGIAVAIQNALLSAGKSCNIVVPNNILRTQYLEEFDHLTTVLSQDEYTVPKHAQWIGRAKVPYKAMSIKAFRNQYGCWPRNNPYTKDLREVKRKDSAGVLNFYSYLAHKLYRDCVTFDEGHNLLEMLKTIHAKKIWKHSAGYPDGLKTFGDLMAWAETNTHKKGVPLLLEELSKEHPASVIEHAWEAYHGEYRECIKIKPLSVASKPPLLWPDKVKRIVIMSATISEKDLEYLGLDNRVVRYIDTYSPIPVERRPFIVHNTANMSHVHQDKNLPKIVAKCLNIVDNNKGKKGLIHAPYGLAKKLKKHLGEDPRFLFHDQNNKREMVKKFKESEDKIIIGSGLAEGLDLKGDLARFQIIVKVPYPSLGDSSIRWVAENDPEYYAWLTARELMQMYGRVSRGEDDYGETHVLDSSFESWYNKCQRLIPKWFSESIRHE